MPKFRIVGGKGKKNKKSDPPPFLPDYLRDSSLDIYNSIAKYPIQIPTYWNVNDCSRDLNIEGNLLSIKYNGEHRSAAVRANNCIPKETGIYYFEIDILEGGDDNIISIGVSTLNPSLSRQAGWDPGSVGYHGDNGKKYLEYGHGIKYGPTFTTGDTIGCCINFYSWTIFFTKNGVNLGFACSSNTFEKLYPVVGMKSLNSRIEANFGSRPFKFDIQLYTK
ncbi:9070_t:CDS:2, partial [Scutellospora calospora]